MLNDEQKLKAVETYLKWDLSDSKTAEEALSNIWYVVMEGRLKNESDEV